MEIKSAEKSYQKVTYGSDEFQELLNYIENNLRDESYHICLLTGQPQKPKQDALQQISDRCDRDIKTVDADDLITREESETFKNIERLFGDFNPDDSLLYIKNGKRLCGSYVGYTNSKVKYATPQERYFLKKVQETGGFYIVNLDDTTDGDTTMHRAAQSIVHFPLPQSFFKKMLWNLKHISVHGYQMDTTRPKPYRGLSNNFK